MLTGSHRTAEPESFDVITTFDAVHDQARPLDVLKGHPSLPQARGPLLDAGPPGSSHVHKNIGHPLGAFLYTSSPMHGMTVSLAQGGEDPGAMWGEEKTR